jgi:hypothetical protein
VLVLAVDLRDVDEEAVAPFGDTGISPMETVE